ncbi:glycoprotein 3-alpha-L-fucosyltransferase A-like [Drosophila subobscura]|uniref:glycoprotein 3-alpha-L-fucosyltransferase A-like n=1 Tax=Drosophila subobscura TaxID=7241 RepID=UPI00155AF116|nr:glycoprotein 3-alpha-L-fucosyltransferase A-like [Drosophila subobscura]
MRIRRKCSIKKCVYFALIGGLLAIIRFNFQKNDGLDEQIVPVDQQQKREVKPKSPAIAKKPWYFKNGELYPGPAIDYSLGVQRQAIVHKLLPDQVLQNDRIANQLMYVPHNYAEIKTSGKLKTILLPHGLLKWNVTKGREIFLSDKCPVDTCQITEDNALADTADMIIHKEFVKPMGKPLRKSKQINMIFSRAKYVQAPDTINWTASYRRESTIVAPYMKWMYYNEQFQDKPQDRNFAEHKRKKVAWFVSNCKTENNRFKYALELQKYIEVDIYGECGKLRCSKSTPEKCFKLLEKNYKFYLAFENCNCKDYITQKFLVNALDRGVVPIVMGARPEDYLALAPRHSFIHVDNFDSPKALAAYLKVLDRNDELYNSYFMWRGTGEFIETYFWCRVCAMLHYDADLRKQQQNRSSNENLSSGMCSLSSWKGRAKTYDGTNHRGGLPIGYPMMRD